MVSAFHECRLFSSHARSFRSLDVLVVGFVLLIWLFVVAGFVLSCGCWLYLFVAGGVLFFGRLLPVPVAARSKAWVCGRSLAGIEDTNAAGCMDFCLL